MSNEVNVGINFTVTAEYFWEGPVSDLPASIRKGVVGKAGMLDEEVLTDNIRDDDSALSKLVKDSSLQDEQIELDEITEM